MYPELSCPVYLNWSEWLDLNQRPLGPKPSALSQTELHSGRSHDYVIIRVRELEKIVHRPRGTATKKLWSINNMGIFFATEQPGWRCTILSEPMDLSLNLRIVKDRAHQKPPTLISQPPAINRPGLDVARLSRDGQTARFINVCCVYNGFKRNTLWVKVIRTDRMVSPFVPGRQRGHRIFSAEVYQFCITL